MQKKSKRVNMREKWILSASKNVSIPIIIVFNSSVKVCSQFGTEYSKTFFVSPNLELHAIYLLKLDGHIWKLCVKSQLLLETQI